MREKLRLLSLVLFLATCLPVAAQVFYGSVVGTVEDPTGSVVPNTKVNLLSKETGSSREVNSDEAGRYTFSNVLPGIYDVKAIASGFRTLTRTDINVSPNTVTRVEVRLEVGQAAEQVTVSASAVQLQTDKSDVRHEISGQTLQNIPLPGYRNYQSLMALIPGASPPAFQNAVVDTPGRALRSFVNGTPTNMNNTLVDGAVNINIWLPHHVAYVQPVESIETVSVSTSSRDAEQGMSGGAAVTVVTKSGTNDLHGTGWWFNNNQHFNSAPTYFRPVNYNKPLAILNIFGGNLGGPIKKDKLFYFFNFERTTERTGIFSNYSVAPADMRAGDFSRYTDFTIIYDPATAPQNNAAARTPFPGNRVPANRFNPIFPNIYNKMPLPNQRSTSGDTLDLVNNYGLAGTLKLNRNQYDTKVNYNISRNFIAWGKYSRMDAPVEGKYPFGDLGGAAIGTEGKGDTTTQIAAGGFTYTFSSTFLTDGVYGYTRMDQAVTIPGLDRNIGLDEWKIPGTNGGRQFANDLRYGSAPQLTGLGFSDLGYTAGWTPVTRAERSYTYRQNFSKLNGAHEFRWGGEIRKMNLTHWQPETANPRGQISFNGGVTAIPGQTVRSPNNFATALLGLVSSYNKSIQYFEMKTREWQYSLYFRDRWQVSRNFTVNLGVQYELYPMLNRDGRGIERWDPATNIASFGGLGGIPMNNGVEINKKMFAPNVGLAYRIGDKWVIRAGYGINYDPLALGRPLRGLYPATLTGSWVPTVSTFGWFNSINEGIPDIATPDLSKGSLVLPNNVDMGPRSPWAGPLHRGYIQSWNFTVERRLPWNMIGNAAYVGTKVVHQFIDRNINSSGPGEDVSTANRPLAKLYGRTIPMNMWDGIGQGKYHSLQTSLNRSFAGGFLAKINYTWSKAMNMADDNGWVGLRSFNWAPAINRNYTLAGYDRTHAFTAGWNYEIPVGKGKKVGLTNSFANAVIGGWKVAGTFIAYSGTPFSVSGSAQSLQAAGNSQTADLIAPAVRLGGKGPGQPYFDPMSFRDPLFSTAAGGAYRFGTMGPNTLRGPGYWQLNPGLFKEWMIRERTRLEFRAEAQNFTNTPIWGNPNAGSASLRLNADGSLNRSVADPIQNFMSITGASAGRQFRFGLRLAF
ncbi:MAG: TonB-dependent receptor [Bryobacteraceae bacterium]|nr:TonB-dependent receptor [Bryobacteraceae bacterium]